MMSTGLSVATTPRIFTRLDSSKQSLPLPPDFFEKLSVTGAAAREYEIVAQALVNNAVDRSRKERIYGGADDSWRDIGAANGFKRYTKVEGRSQFYRIQGVVCAPMANVMSMLYAERNASIVSRRNVFYGNGLDGQTLKTLRERTNADRHQHLTLRWEAFNISTATVNYKFDASFLEYTGITLDQDREPVGFKLMHSIELPPCKPLIKSHGLRRMDCTEVMILRPSANTSYTEITIEGSFEVTDKLPPVVISSYLTQITYQLTKVPMEIQAHRLAAIKVLDKAHCVPTSERKHCSVCLSRFGMMTKKHNCRSCGEVVCKSCVVARPQREEDKFCKKCVVVACAEDDVIIPDRHNPLSTPSSSSTSTRNRDVIRDSYIFAVAQPSDHESHATPTSNQQPHRPSPRQQYQYAHTPILVDLKRMREDNNSVGSMTASETSYGSTYSSSSYLNDNIPSQDAQEREISMVYLETKRMQRAAPKTHSTDKALSSIPRSYSGRTQPPMMHHVESSLAQQRYLLKEMMLASHGPPRPGRGYTQYPVSSDF